MKRLLFLIAVLVTSCTPFALNVQGYDSPHEDLQTAWRAVAAYHYISDGRASLHYWKSPREFERDGGGMCADFTADLLYRVGRGSAVWYVRTDGVKHSVCLIDGRLIEPQEYGREVEVSDVFAVLSWDEVMTQCTWAGVKGL